ncbi:MAG: aminopeptidase P family protein [Pseudomonadota bacterium]|nr:aminopeptidase P family protein [Pseudomonadota bacterium]
MPRTEQANKSDDLIRELQARRNAVLMCLPANGVVIIRAATKKVRSNDTHYTYRQNSHFYYLTSLDTAGTLCVMTHQETILFYKPQDPVYERWEGKLPTAEEIQAQTGCSHMLPISEFTTWCEKNLKKNIKIYGRVDDKAWYKQWWSGEFAEIDNMVMQLRAVKSDAEINLLQHACNITVQAQQETIKNSKKFRSESIIAGYFKWACHHRGAPHLAYNSIVAQGNNACVLHYHALTSQIDDDNCILMDAGAEYMNYAADITRVWPSRGKFTAEQKAIYEACLAVQKQCIAHVKPGVTLRDLNSICEIATCQKLQDLGFLQASIEEIKEKGLHKPFFCHSVGHSIGLDVHDPMDKDRKLEKNMVITIEPGIYISQENTQVSSGFRGIGVRIEDMVCVTENASLVMSSSLEKSIKDIESLCSG